MFNIKNKRVVVQLLIASAILIAGFTLIFLEPVITGYIPYGYFTIKGNISAVNNKSLLFLTQNSSDVLSLSSLKVSGRVIGSGSAKVYLKTEDGKKLLIFSSENFPKEPGILSITGFAPSNKGKSGSSISSDDKEKPVSEGPKEQQEQYAPDLIKEIKKEKVKTLKNAIKIDEEKRKAAKKAGITEQNPLIYNVEKLTEKISLTFTLDEQKKEEKIQKYKEEIKAEEEIINYFEERENIEIEIITKPETVEETAIKEKLINESYIKQIQFKSECQDTCLIKEPVVSNYYEIVIEVEPGTLIEIDDIIFTIK